MIARDETARGPHGAATELPHSASSPAASTGFPSPLSAEQAILRRKQPRGSPCQSRNTQPAGRSLSGLCQAGSPGAGFLAEGHANPNSRSAAVRLSSTIETSRSISPRVTTRGGPIWIDMNTRVSNPRSAMSAVSRRLKG
jgi:hypothetical protein